mgnify:CR=1 FL=1
MSDPSDIINLLNKRKDNKMSLGTIGVKSICGAVTTQIKIKDLFEDMSNEVFCCDNCYSISETRENWHTVYVTN